METYQLQQTTSIGTKNALAPCTVAYQRPQGCRSETRLSFIVKELHGKGTFFDERFDKPEQFPIAAKAGLRHVSTDPDSDKVTSKLPLHFGNLR